MNQELTLKCEQECSEVQSGPQYSLSQIDEDTLLLRGHQ